MLNEFTSVFTREDTSNIPTLNGQPYPSIENLQIHQDGVTKLLKDLDPNKASGPDNIPCRLLKQLIQELSPVVTAICCQSLESGILPVDWTEAIISPIYKKGNAANYWPVSLTSVICKVMEHIICKHILNYLDLLNILSAFQHGFRRAHSCESQLLLIMTDLLYSFDKIQTDVAILDFSRAFDTVPHEHLLRKLDYYDIRGKIKTWVRSFHCYRQMWVANDVDSPPKARHVRSPARYSSWTNVVPTFYKRVTTTSHSRYNNTNIRRWLPSIQGNKNTRRPCLSALENWSTKWGMCFNPTKCNIIKLHRLRTP